MRGADESRWTAICVTGCERRSRSRASSPGADIAVASATLDQDVFPGDPIDRIIYATARDAGAVLVTRDRALLAFDAQNTVW